MSNEKKELTRKAKYDIQYAKNNIKRVPLDMPKDKYEKVKTAADAAGEKVNEYIKKAIAQRMERESEVAKSEDKRPGAGYGNSSPSSDGKE